MQTHNYIHLNRVKIFAHHGVDPQEQLTGAYFYVTLKVEYNFTNAILTDELDGTISYADLFDIVKKEMAISSNLLENVGGRIAANIKRKFPQVMSITLSIDKENPPMGAECDGAGIDISIIY